MDLSVHETTTYCQLKELLIDTYVRTVSLCNLHYCRRGRKRMNDFFFFFFFSPFDQNSFLTFLLSKVEFWSFLFFNEFKFFSPLLKKQNNKCANKSCFTDIFSSIKCLHKRLSHSHTFNTSLTQHAERPSN